MVPVNISRKAISSAALQIRNCPIVLNSMEVKKQCYDFQIDVILMRVSVLI